MNYPAVQIIVQVFQLLLTLGVAWFVWHSTRGQVKEQRMIDNETKAEERFDGHDHRITIVEATLRHMPKDSDLKDLHARIDPVVSGLAGLAATVEGLKTIMSGVAAHVKSINDYLLEEKKS